MKYRLSFLLFICLSILDVNAKCKYVISFTQPDIFKAPTIFLASVLNENETQIMWENKLFDKIDYYNIYRNSQDTDVGWTLIGRINYPINYFNDIYPYSNKQSYEYKISYVDVCGNEVFSSIIHKTIKLNLVEDNNKRISLNWNSYEGMNIESYHILRGTTPTNMITIDSVYSSSTSYFDEFVSTENQYYQVEAYSSIQDSDLVNKDKVTRLKIKSNIVSTQEDGNLEIKSDIKLYPNPYNSYSNVVIPDDDSPKPYKIYIFDMTGKILYRQNIYSNYFLMENMNLKAGLYFLQITGSKIYRKKFVIVTRSAFREIA